MLVSELIRLSIDTAVAGSPADSNILESLRLEAESLVDQALHALATDIAGSFPLRARLEKTFTIPLVDGIGVIPDDLLMEYVREGSVRDSDPVANNGFGNILQRVQHYNDFIRPLTPVFSYYCLVSNKIYTRAIDTGDFLSVVSPLLIDAPFVPTKANLNTSVPVEVQDELVKLLAEKIRGAIGRILKPTRIED